MIGGILLLVVSAGTAANGQGAEGEDRSTLAPTHRVEELFELSVEQLMEQPVTIVERRETTVQQSPAAVSVITQDDIRRSGATTISELFRRIPGMDVARIDNNKWAISVRGFNDRFSNKLLVQQDGRSFYDPSFAAIVRNAMDYPLEDIERIEVVRGPGASVWGANAVNGVINIITRSAQDTQGGLLSGGVGNEERGFGTVRYGGQANSNLFYRVYAKGFNRDRQFSLYGDPNDSWWGSSTGMRLDWLPNPADTVTFQGDYLHSDAGRRDVRIQPTPPRNVVVADRFISDNGNVLGRWTHQIDEAASWTFQSYWARFNSKQPQADVQNRFDTVDLDFQHQFPIGDRNEFNYGLSYRYANGFTGSTLSDNGLSLSWRESHRTLSYYSAFLQDEYSLVPDALCVLLGSKFEHNDFTGFEIQPTGRLLWTPTRRQTVWASVSRAVRTPSVLEDGILLANPVVTLPSGTTVFPRTTGNPNLLAENLMAYEVGYRAQLARPLSVDAAVFYHDYDRLIIGVPQSPQGGPVAGTATLPILFENRMNGETYGFEVGADWRPAPRWRLYGAYSLLKMNLHADPSLAASTRAEAESAEGRSPQQQVYLQSSWDLGRKWEVDVAGRYVDGLPGFVQAIPAYVALDVRLAWKPRKNLELAIVGQNLLDNHHPEFGASSLISTPVVEIERSIYGKVTWRF